jgi:hypothetical protein
MNDAPANPAGPPVTFRATILLGGKTATGIRVPDAVVTALGASKRPAVHATVNGYAYRSTIASMRGDFMLPVSADVRERANVRAHDEVDVELRLDTEPRTVTVPPDFAAALAEHPAAQDVFNTLSYSNKQRFVLSIEGAKTDETRQRRIVKAVATLREERT